MTLLIACILIYHFGLSGWWYALALFIWTWHLAFQLWMSSRHYLPGRTSRIGAFFTHGLVSEPPRVDKTSLGTAAPHGIGANE
ncbi:MAG TPA: hypothetical protein VG501_09380 [Rhizomicrobium sp.]|nr:hypothetical protein [Rhizomicrobium sp.]